MSPKVCLAASLVRSKNELYPPLDDCFLNFQSEILHNPLSQSIHVRRKTEDIIHKINISLSVV